MLSDENGAMILTENTAQSDQFLRRYLPEPMRSSFNINRIRQSAFAALALLLLPLPAFSLNYIVNSTSDGIDVNLDDGLCAAASGQCTLRAAIQQSNAWPGPDTLVLPAGTYTLSLPGIDDNATMGDLDITESLRISGAGAAATLIDGNGTITRDRVFQIFSGAVVTMSGITIENGRASINGGGIANDGDLTLSNALIQNNQSTSQTQGGGGIFNTGTLAIGQSTFSGNSTQGNGGAIDIITGSATISSSLIDGNSAVASGGGLAINAGGAQPVTVSITDSTLSGNSATGTLVNGSATGGLGGGLFNFGRLSITRSILSGNMANIGGGIYNNGIPPGSLLAGQLTVTDSTLSNNTATSFDGGGAFIVNQASFIRSTITKNSSLQPGGGVAVETSGTNQGALNLQGTIIATQLAGGDCSGGTNITSNGFNLDSDSSCNLKVSSGDLQGTDPLLSAIGANGGPTTTYALQAGSPAIDVITSGCSSADLDQRGISRADGVNSGPSCDIGAYERTNQEATWTDLAIRAELTPNPVSKSGTLNYHISVTNNGPNNATNVILSDTLGTGGINGLNLGALSAAATMSRDIPATALATPGPMNDTISVSADQADLNTSNDSATISTEVVTTTDLAITTTLKDSNNQAINPNDTVIAGFPLNYTLNISNSGELARTVVLNDQLPAGAVLGAITAPPGVSCDIPAASNFVCTLGDLAAGANIAIRFVLTPQLTGSAANVALINFNGSDPTPPRDTFSISVIARADLALTLSATPDPVDAGADLAYTFKVVNDGPSPANNLVMTLSLDPNTTLKSIEPQRNDPQTPQDQQQPLWACNPANNTLNCTLSRLDVGRDNSVTIFVTTGSNIAGTMLTTTASVSSDAQDPASGNNSIIANTQVTPNPVLVSDLSVSMNTNVSPATAGDSLRYTIGVTNNGPDDASNVTLSDILPNSVTLISTPVGCSFTSGTNTVTCNLGTIIKGTSAGILIDVRPDTAGIISNRAVVSGGNDPDNSNNTVSVDTTVQPPPVGVNSPRSGLKKGGGAAFALLVLLAGGLAWRRRTTLIL